MTVLICHSDGHSGVPRQTPNCCVLSSFSCREAKLEITGHRSLAAVKRYCRSAEAIGTVANNFAALRRGIA